MVVDVVIPALNEQRAIGRVLSDLKDERIRNVYVVDNGSTDKTAQIAAEHGAIVVVEPRRGYGAACLRGLAELSSQPPDVVAFLDGDYSDDPGELATLLDTLETGADFVIGSRTLGDRERGALLPQARFGNWLSTRLIDTLFAVRFTDLGPFRAIRWEALRLLAMQDLDFGWTVEMQARAARRRLRCAEVPVSYRRRIGQSKVSGTVSGSIKAGAKILWVIAREAVADRLERSSARRATRPSQTPYQPRHASFTSSSSARRATRPSEVPSRRAIVVMAKLPIPGHVNTRMHDVWSPTQAAELQRLLLLDLLGRELPMAEARTLSLAVPSASSGSNAASASFEDRVDSSLLERWPALSEAVEAGGWALDVQRGEGLGVRMGLAASKLLATHDQVLVLGTDAPGIPTDTLSALFGSLDRCAAGVVPAADGGYVALALRREGLPLLFEPSAWGTSTVLAQTLAIADAHGLCVEQHAPWFDLDTVADIKANLVECSGERRARLQRHARRVTAYCHEQLRG